jgi:hypothetical protein
MAYSGHPYLQSLPIMIIVVWDRLLQQLDLQPAAIFKLYIYTIKTRSRVCWNGLTEA